MSENAGASGAAGGDDGAPTFDRDRAGFVDLASGGGPAVVRLAATLDVDVSPLAAYAALTGRDPAAATAAGDGHSFLLESGGEKTPGSDPGAAFRPPGTDGEDRHARFSFLGYDPDAVVSVRADDVRVQRLGGTGAGRYVPDCEALADAGDTLDALRAALPDADRRGFPDTDRQLLDGGLVGFLGYDAVYDCWLDEVGVERPPGADLDAAFVLTTKTLVFDHASDEVRLVFTPVVGSEAGTADPGTVYDDLVAEAAHVSATLADAEPPRTGGFDLDEETANPREDYEAAVETAKRHVLDGDIYQGVVSRRRRLTGDLDVLALYESLRSVNPSPYMYVLDHGERAVVGASPETFVSVRDGTVVSNPIAGTCPRGASPVEDRRLAGEMLADEKERAEHTMLVDLARNDVRRVSEPGSVRVPEFMRVLKYSHVQHIESTVTGALAADADAFDAARATFPAGTLSGAPKVRAMEIIDDLEAGPRGVYGGGIGYFSWTGDADFAIVIRTAVVERGAAGTGADGTPTRDTITVQAGAGVVADSDPASEYYETEGKMGAVLDALDAITPNADVGPDVPDGSDAESEPGTADRPPAAGDGGEP
ncbi:MAG: anthranilate synthase component I [Halobacteriaceae archaeon]